MTYLNAELENKILSEYCTPQLIANIVSVVDRMRHSGGSYGFDRPPAPEEMEQLTCALNAILRESDLYSEAAFAEARLEKQARRLLALSSTRELSLPEQTRLNRLLLEGAYRDSIRKVFGQGWRRVMFVYALLGLCVAACFWFVFRNGCVPGLSLSLAFRLGGSRCILSRIIFDGLGNLRALGLQTR